MTNSNHRRAESDATAAFGGNGQPDGPRRWFRGPWGVVAAGGLITAVLAATLVILLPRGDHSREPAKTTTPVAHVVTGGIGDPLRVGSLALRVIEVNAAFDGSHYAPANTATSAVHIAVTNAGDTGNPIQLATKDFRLIDEDAGGHGTVGCAQCPAVIGNVNQLVPNGGIDGWLYFALPAGTTASQLVYTGATGITATITLR